MDKATESTNTTTNGNPQRNCSASASNCGSGSGADRGELSSSPHSTKTTYNEKTITRLGCGQLTTPTASRRIMNAKSLASGVAATNMNTTIQAGNLAEISKALYFTSSSSNSNNISHMLATSASKRNNPANAVVPSIPINVNINTTTGGNFSISVDPLANVELLKKIVSKKLKVVKDRICLLHREKKLQDGSLKDNNIVDGSKIILIPNVETGLLAQRPENTVMQALESLNDSQVNDFLSGKTPLNLSMRLGDHMMLIQLQLSTVHPAGGSGSASTLNGSSNNTGNTTATRTRSNQQRVGYHHHRPSSFLASTSTATIAGKGVATEHHQQQHNSHQQHYQHQHQQQQQNHSNNSGSEMPVQSTDSSTSAANVALKNSTLSSLIGSKDFENLQNIVKRLSMSQSNHLAGATTSGVQTISAIPKAPADSSATDAHSQVSKLSVSSAFNRNLLTTIASSRAASTQSQQPSKFAIDTSIAEQEQSPIKSLSNLVSNPMNNTTIANIPMAFAGEENLSGVSLPCVPSTTAVTPMAGACQDPIAARLTSCLCTRLNAGNAENRNYYETKSSTQQQRNPLISSAANHPLEGLKTAITPSPASGFSSSALHKTANNPIGRSSKHHHYHRYYHCHHRDGNVSPISRSKCMEPGAGAALFNRSSSTATSIATPILGGSGFGPVYEDFLPTSSSIKNMNTLTAASTTLSTTTTSSVEDSPSYQMSQFTEARTLAEASRNLTQTLRKLSKEVFTKKLDLSSGGDDIYRKADSGAIIESMKNHGKGIYSGTFSGTLNPALQDRYGRPKRDISTVIHILNDLLSATPHYSRGAKITLEQPIVSGRANNKATKMKQSSLLSLCQKCTRTYSGNSKSAKNVSFSCPNDALTSRRNFCSCRFRIIDEVTDGRGRESMCQKCLVESENHKTKSKLDQLRLVMQQRKQKREARKVKGAPYGTRVVGAVPPIEMKPSLTNITPVAAASTSNKGGSSSSTCNASQISPTPLSSSPSSNSSAAATTAATPGEVSPNHQIVEEVDTAA